MIILGKKGLSGAVKIFLDFIFIGGILIFVSLPFTLKMYFDFIGSADSICMGIFEKYTRLFVNINNNQESYVFFLALLLVTGLFALWIVFNLRKVLKNLNLMNPFVIDNVRSFKNISISSFVIAICYFIKMFFYNSFLTIVLTMVFVILGLFSLILSEVFRQAVLVKEENDLTI